MTESHVAHCQKPRAKKTTKVAQFMRWNTGLDNKTSKAGALSIPEGSSSVFTITELVFSSKDSKVEWAALKPHYIIHNFTAALD